jgi:hypothetical protein
MIDGIYTSKMGPVLLSAMIKEFKKVEITSEECLCDEEDAPEDCGVSIGPGQTMVTLMPFVHNCNIQ